MSSDFTDKTTVANPYNLRDQCNGECEEFTYEEADDNLDEALSHLHRGGSSTHSHSHSHQIRTLPIPAPPTMSAPAAAIGSLVKKGKTPIAKVAPRQQLLYDASSVCSSTVSARQLTFQRRHNMMAGSTPPRSSNLEITKRTDYTYAYSPSYRSKDPSPKVNYPMMSRRSIHTSSSISGRFNETVSWISSFVSAGSERSETNALENNDQSKQTTQSALFQSSHNNLANSGKLVRYADFSDNEDDDQFESVSSGSSLKSAGHETTVEQSDTIGNLLSSKQRCGIGCTVMKCFRWCFGWILISMMAKSATMAFANGVKNAFLYITSSVADLWQSDHSGTVNDNVASVDQSNAANHLSDEERSVRQKNTIVTRRRVNITELINNQQNGASITPSPTAVVNANADERDVVEKKGNSGLSSWCCCLPLYLCLPLLILLLALIFLGASDRKEEILVHTQASLWPVFIFLRNSTRNVVQKVSQFPVIVNEFIPTFSAPVPPTSSSTSSGSYQVPDEFIRKLIELESRFVKLESMLGGYVKSSELDKSISSSNDLKSMQRSVASLSGSFNDLTSKVIHLSSVGVNTGPGVDDQEQRRSIAAFSATAQSDLSALKIQIADLEKSLSSSQSVLVSLSTTVDGQNAKIGAGDTALTSLMIALKQIEHKFADTSSSLAALEGELRVQGDDIVASNKRNNELKQSLVALRAALESSSKDSKENMLTVTQQLEILSKSVGSSDVNYSDLSKRLTAVLAAGAVGGGVISKGCDCPSGMNVDSIESLIAAAIAKYDLDKTGKADHAMEPAGGCIISTRCSETYAVTTRKESIFGIPLWYTSYSPRTVIQPGVTPGECWAFAGTKGFLVVQLTGWIEVESISYEHIAKSMAPDGHIESAPREMEIYGLKNEKDNDGVLLTKFSYDQNGEPLQEFTITNKNAPAIPIIELRVVSNHGHPVYTCLYRLRVHGRKVKPSYGNEA